MTGPGVQMDPLASLYRLRDILAQIEAKAAEMAPDSGERRFAEGTGYGVHLAIKHIVEDITRAFAAAGVAPPELH